LPQEEAVDQIQRVRLLRRQSEELVDVIQRELRQRALWQTRVLVEVVLTADQAAMALAES
jgi:hypothetical protein